MMDGRALVEYKLIIKKINPYDCPLIDPIGLCYVEDCIECSNTKVKIIREDGTVMRDDFVNKKHSKEQEELRKFKWMIEKLTVHHLEEMYNTRLSKFSKWYLKRLSRKLKKKED